MLLLKIDFLIFFLTSKYKYTETVEQWNSGTVELETSRTLQVVHNSRMATKNDINIRI